MNALAQALPVDDDPYRWLEEVQGERALTWVRARNAESLAVLESRPGYEPLRAKLLSMLDSRDRIAYPSRRGDWLYNVWQDKDHPRGLWRRTRFAEYRKAEPLWQTLIDLDALGAAEHENWVWGGAQCFGPTYRRCLVQLSRGGADAKVVREFDAVDLRFVADGFALPEAKSDVEWMDADTVYVATDFGAGSLTDSGYPRVIKRWQRGQPLGAAVTVFEGLTSDVSVDVSVDRTPGFERTLFRRATDFYHHETFLLRGTELLPLDVPDDASVAFMRDTMLVELRSDLTIGASVHPRGALLAADAAAWQAGRREVVELFTPTATRSLSGWTTTRGHVLLSVLDNVSGRLEEWAKDGARFTHRTVDAPSPGTLGVTSLFDPLVDLQVNPLADLEVVPRVDGALDQPADPQRKSSSIASPAAADSSSLADRYLLTYTDFLTPDSLLLGRAGTDAREPLKARPALFDSTGMHTRQFFATSKDGTRVPYFVVWPKGRDAAAPADGSAPTALYGYGGFEISMQPTYSGVWGEAWVARGGVYVLANIRGGGEFGPAWHQAAIRERKQNSYDDFIAVAEDLIARRITSPRRLGIMGGSNGGLLVGAVFVQRPDLFNAVVCQVPLLDMQRYSKLLAGASWMGEYGNPDVPADWAFMARYSPYQNVQSGVRYPEVFFATSTRDDRVHPGHARKMAAKMIAQGHPLLYYENIEGGHGGAADNAQRARLQALEFSYLWQQLGQTALAPDAGEAPDRMSSAPSTSATLAPATGVATAKAPPR